MMVKKPTYKAIRSYFGSVASGYDAARRLEPVWRREHELLVECLDRLPRETRLLDVPVGTGRFLREYLARGFEVDAVDVSSDMISHARRELGVMEAQVRWHEAAAEYMPFDDSSFDAIVCWRLLHLVPGDSVPAVLSELARLCRGVIFLHVFAVRVEPQGAARWRRIGARVDRVVRRVGRALSRFELMPWSRIESFSHSEDELFVWFRNAGLVVEARRIIDIYAGRPVMLYVLRSV